MHGGHGEARRGRAVMGCFGTYCSGVFRFGSHGRNVGARTERHGSAVQESQVMVGTLLHGMAVKEGNVMVRLDWAGIAEAALDCQGGEVRDGKGSRGLTSRVNVWLGLAA